VSRRGSTPKKNPTTGMYEVMVDTAPPGAKRRQERVRAKTKAELQRLVNEKLVNVDRGTHVSPTKVTLREWSDKWLASLPATGPRDRTCDFYGDMTGHIVRHLGDARLQSLLPADLNRCYAALRNEGLRPGPGLSRATVRKVHVTAHKMLADAVKEGLVARNVADLASPPSTSSTRPPEMQTWTPAELAEFLAFVEGDRLAVLLRVAGMTGMRVSELCGLKWSDFDGDRISVQRQATRGGTLTDVKTAQSRRSIDLDPETVGALGRHRRAQLEERMALGIGGRPEMMFTEPDGSLLNPQRVSRSFDNLVRRSALLRIRFHDLRHSHATHLIKAGAHPKVVADRLGHVSASFCLDRYAHVLAGMGADAAAAVAALVDG
jgi:integrase